MPASKADKDAKFISLKPGLKIIKTPKKPEKTAIHL